MSVTTPAYLCPVCRRNRSKFELIYKFTQEIIKNEHTGDIVFKADEYISPLQPDGRPDIDVKCGGCHYVALENVFIGEARRSDSVAR